MRWRCRGVLLLAAAAAACNNAGEDRVLGVTATGVVDGFVYFDEDGNRIAEESTDRALPDVRVSFLVAGTNDTAASTLSGSDGTFRVTGLPVGRYAILVDSGMFGDTIGIVEQDSTTLTVQPADTIGFRVGVSFPTVGIAELEASTLGRKVFVHGVALAALGVFGDTTLHVADTTEAIRAVRVRRATVFAGDSVRLLGVRGRRDSQPVLDDVRVFPAGFGSLPPAETVGTGAAAGADGGRLDAALVRVSNVAIADTVTRGRDFVLTVDDGSGVLEIVLDDDAALDTTPYEPGVNIDALGLLVPDGTGGWALKPRTDADLVTN